jgi:predicted Zn-dependent protease
MKITKKLAFLLTICIVFMAMTTPLMAFSLSGQMEENNNALLEYNYATQALLTSAIDGSPFHAFFDSETGTITFVDMNGIFLGERHNYTEEGFWELVKFNSDLTSKTIEQRMAEISTLERTNKNVAIIDIETKTFIQYDEHGNRTETYLSDDLKELFSDVFVEQNNMSNSDMTADIEQLLLMDVTESSQRDTGATINSVAFDITVNTWFPWLNMPGFSGSLVGGSYRFTNSNTTHVILQTNWLPVATIDVFITNLIGDCFSRILDIRAHQEGWHNVRFRGEPYGAFVSSFHGSGTATFRYRAHGNVSMPPPIIRNPSFDGQQFSNSNVNTAWDWINGATYTLSLRNLSTNQQIYSNVWLGNSTSMTIPQQVFSNGNNLYLITVFATANGQTTWSERTFWMNISQSGTLTVNPSSWNVPPANAATRIIRVTSNSSWNASSNATGWLTVSSGSGSGNGQFTLSTTVNTTSSTRSGTITITGGGQTRTISVIQAPSSSTTPAIWHDGEINWVGVWPENINIHTQTLGTVSSGFQFATRMSESRSDWSGALNVTFGTASSATNAQIRALGGTTAGLEEFRGFWNPNWAGLAEHPTLTDTGSITISNTIRTVRQSSGQSRMFVLEMYTSWGTWETNVTRMVTTHELGHSLGYWGHSTADSTDVMWFQAHAHFSLNDNERKHLRQIYDHFRP